MIYVALGSNVSGPWGTPRQTLMKAFAALDQQPCWVVKASDIYVTTPFGVKDQPDFVNAVVRLKTKLQPQDLLKHLQSIEKDAGRERKERWGPRTLDLDIIDYKGMKQTWSNLSLPHPGIAERDFVLRPLYEIAPRWRHPVTKRSAREMLDALSKS